MLPNTDCYGRLGAKAGSAEHVTALVGRTTDGLIKAVTAMNATLDRIKIGGFVPWSATAGDMTVLHAQWVALMTWEWATAATDAGVLLSEGADIDAGAYALALSFCSDAADQSMHAMQMESAFVKSDKRPGNTALLSPQLHINAKFLELVWELVVVTYMRVAADMATIRRLGVPPRFAAAYQQLENEFRTNADIFGYLYGQWNVSTDIASRRQIVQDAVRLHPTLYAIGQRIWAPYLNGRVFAEALRSSAIFDKYQLGIDPWVVTAPSEATVRSADQQSCVQLAEFWKTMADPRSVVALQSLINDAVILGQAEPVASSTYRIPPWHQAYRTFEPLTLGTFQCDANTIFAINFRGPAGQRVAELRVTGKV